MDLLTVDNCCLILHLILENKGSCNYGVIHVCILGKVWDTSIMHLFVFWKHWFCKNGFMKCYWIVGFIECFWYVSENTGVVKIDLFNARYLWCLLNLNFTLGNQLKLISMKIFTVDYECWSTLNVDSNFAMPEDLSMELFMSEYQTSLKMSFLGSCLPQWLE